MSLVSGRRLVAVDVETTGWSARENTILEVATVTIEAGAIVQEWSSFVGPPRPVPAETARILGITSDMLAGAPEPLEIAARMREAAADLPLVMHNAPFDLPFVRRLLQSCGVPPLWNPVIDTLGLARGLFGAGGNTLSELAERLGLPGERFHRALGDARTTARLLIQLAPRWESERGVRSLAELAAASQDGVRTTSRRPPPSARAEPAVSPEGRERGSPGAV